MNYKDILAQNGQEHLQEYIEVLSKNNPTAKDELIKDIENIDYKELKELYNVSKETEDNEKAIESIIVEHLPFTNRNKLSPERYNKLYELGANTIKANEYAVVTLAGGQGTRLGHTGPKGTFLLNVQPKPKYLFEIIVDDLKRAEERFGVVINWYIMVSHENEKQTRDFLEEHNYFGYPKDHVMLFAQGDKPLLSEDGKLLINRQFRIKLAADGNGCIYKAMANEGVIDDMKAKGIKWVFTAGVDNVLAKNIDPILLGLTIDEGNQIASKSVAKAYPSERVGVFCKKNGSPAVIEYSEIPVEMTEEHDEDGELLFGEANIVNHLFTLDAIELIASKPLPYHSAHKKANYTLPDGSEFVASEPNAYKYEAFIFDGFRYFKEMSLLRGVRENEFAPIKNATGKDSPETAIELYNNYWKQ